MPATGTKRMNQAGSDGNLPELPPLPARRNSRLLLSLQFFVVPGLILAVCVSLFLLIRYLTEETMSAEEIFDRMRESDGRKMQFYASMLAEQIRKERSEFREPPSARLRSLAGRILEVAKEGLKRPQTEQVVGTLRYLVHAVGNIGDPDMAPGIADILEADVAEEVRWSCLDALGALRNPATIGAVRRFLDDPSPNLRKWAAYNLAAFGDPAAAPDLKKKLLDAEAEVRWNAATGLAVWLRDASGLPVLLEMLDRAKVEAECRRKNESEGTLANTVAQVMVNGVRAVAVLKDPRALERLQQLADSDPDHRVRTSSLHAIRAIRE